MGAKLKGMSRVGQRFVGKVAIITGGASGMGAATARRLADEGAEIVLADLTEAPEDLIAACGGDARAYFHRTDVSDPEQVTALVESAVERFGGVDVLFNNAGIGSFGETPDLSIEEWRKVLSVDLDAVFFGCKAAIPHMRNRGGGAIVNTASVSGLGGDYGFAAYNAAKGAVVNYTRTLALDHGKDNIRANAVCPGLIDTRLARAIIQHDEIQAHYRAHHPMGRAGRAEEVASAVAFLASDDASFVNGAMLTVDGGLSAGTGQPNFPSFFGR